MDKPAIEKIKDAVRSEIRRKRQLPLKYESGEWYSLTEAEAEVFNIDLDDINVLASVWLAYIFLSELATGIDIDKETEEAFWADNPWFKKGEEDEEDWIRFSKLFNIREEKARGWFYKARIYDYRRGGYI